MPPRGYAQGMISSYARFLGLNPREVVNAYFDDLMAYERETSQQGGRFQDAAGYVNSRSSVDNGRFLMVQGGRSTRYGQRPPQAGYITETGSSEEIRSQRDRFRSTPMPDDRALPAARGLRAIPAPVTATVATPVVVIAEFLPGGVPAVDMPTPIPRR